MTIKFEPLQSNSRSSLVFATLKDAIFKGQLKPGESLRELHLASDFGVSQSTIREALMQLENFGLVEKVPHKGTRVIDKTEKEIREGIVVRFQLEELAGIKAGKNMTDEDIEELKKIDEKIQDAVKENAYFKLIQYDLEFHKFIWGKSENTVLLNILEQITVPLFAALSIEHSKQEKVLANVVQSHSRIIEALKSKDPAIIREVYREDAKDSYGIHEV